MEMRQTDQRTCVRCRQPLAGSSKFCVACGCTNDVDASERMQDALSKADERIAWVRWRGQMMRVLGGVFWWLR
jgi:hypothetical protein